METSDQLQQNSTKNTRQRTAILDVIRHSEGPLSVPQILGRAQKQVPTLGLATVYRTVILLKEQNKIIQVDLPGVDPHFELIGRGHHHHFQCANCGRVFELQDCPINLSNINLEPGFVVEDHHLTLYGRCSDCKEL